MKHLAPAFLPFDLASLLNTSKYNTNCGSCGVWSFCAMPIMRGKMFEESESINEQPEPFEFYTAHDLSTDEHTSARMLSFHLNILRLRSWRGSLWRAAFPLKGFIQIFSGFNKENQL
jgi:hypothetical protein